jgi:preprotein translocase subunit SecY
LIRRHGQLFKQNERGILGMFNMFSGGALSRFAVFALGITPYISASIIMQLASIVSPQMEALKKEGEAGRRKITQYTRYFTVGLALFQAFGIAVALESQQGLVLDPGMAFRFVTVVTLLTGTMFLMWLGEQITERGLGNGISIIIFAGIAAGLPSALGNLFTLVSQRFDQQHFRNLHRDSGGPGDLRCRVRRTRPAQDPGELRETPGR